MWAQAVGKEKNYARTQGVVSVYRGHRLSSPSVVLLAQQRKATSIGGFALPAEGRQREQRRRRRRRERGADGEERAEEEGKSNKSTQNQRKIEHPAGHDGDRAKQTEK